MRPEEILNRGGRFNGGKLKGLVKRLPEKFSVVSALGPSSTGKSSSLNELLRCEFVVGSSPAVQTTYGIQGAAVTGEDLMILSAPPRGLLVLDVEGADSRDVSRKQSQKLAASFALAIADVAVMTLNVRDIGRIDSSGIASFFQTVEENLQMRSKGVITNSKKKLLMTVISDFDTEELSREEAIAALMRDFKTALTSISRPSGFVATRLTDLFEFEFVTLPNRSLFPEEFEKQTGELQARLVNPTVDDYIFEGSDFANSNESGAFVESSSKLWAVLAQNSRTNATPDEEVLATYKCDQCLKEAYRRYQGISKQWKDQVAEGTIITDLGREGDRLMEQTVANYEALASDNRGTKAFERKKAEIKENMMTDLGMLYTEQVNKMRSKVYESFKSKLDRIMISNRLEQDIQANIKAEEKLFVSKAESMKCQGAKWGYRLEKNELLKLMKDLATERKQLAHLNGIHIPGLRPPVNVTFHYLNPSVRPEDFLPANLVGDRPERMITVPQKVRRDRSLKAEKGRMYAHQEENYWSGGGSSGGDFDTSSPF